MSKIDSSYTTLAATFIIKQALNADEDYSWSNARYSGTGLHGS